MGIAICDKFTKPPFLLKQQNKIKENERVRVRSRSVLLYLPLLLIIAHDSGGRKTLEFFFLISKLKYFSVEIEGIRFLKFV